MGWDKVRYKYQKYDKIYAGVIIGAIGPWIGFWLYYLLFFYYATLYWFWHSFLHVPGVSSPILAISLAFDLILISCSFKLKYDKMSKGILGAIIAYFIVIVYLFFFH